MGFVVGPFRSIVGFNLAQEGSFWIAPGYEDLGVGPSGHVEASGVGGSTILVDESPGQINLIYRNPEDPGWEAVCSILYVQTASEAGSFMQCFWVGNYTDSREDDPLVRNNMHSWLDGLSFTIEGYGTLTLGGDLAAFPFDPSPPYRTRYGKFSDSPSGVPMFEQAANISDRTPITYTGWEEYFDPD